MLPYVRQPGWLPRLRSMWPFQSRFRYRRLPLDPEYAKSHGYPFTTINLKAMRWRSPSPGVEARFPILLRMSLSRLVFLAITVLLCLGLMIVGGVRHHIRSRHNHANSNKYPWEKFPMCVASRTAPPRPVR